MTSEANNVTIELVHGGSIHVAHTADDVRSRMLDALCTGSPSVVRLERVTAFDSRQARGFPEVDIFVKHIVGIYPLTSRSDPPRDRTTE